MAENISPADMAKCNAGGKRNSAVSLKQTGKIDEMKVKLWRQYPIGRRNAAEGIYLMERANESVFCPAFTTQEIIEIDAAVLNAGLIGWLQGRFYSIIEERKTIRLRSRRVAPKPTLTTLQTLEAILLESREAKDESERQFKVLGDKIDACGDRIVDAILDGFRQLRGAPLDPVSRQQGSAQNEIPIRVNVVENPFNLDILQGRRADGRQLSALVPDAQKKSSRQPLLRADVYSDADCSTQRQQSAEVGRQSSGSSRVRSSLRVTKGFDGPPVITLPSGSGSLQFDSKGIPISNVRVRNSSRTHERKDGECTDDESCDADNRDLMDLQVDMLGLRRCDVPNKEELALNRDPYSGQHTRSVSSTPLHQANKSDLSSVDKGTRRVGFQEDNYVSDVHDVSTIIVDEVRKTLFKDKSIGTLLRSQDGSRVSVEFLHYEINVNRRYILDKKSLFETFENLLHTELKSRKLHYVLLDDDRNKVDSEKLQAGENKVKDIIINHLSTDYNDMLAHLINSIEVVMEIKSIKQGEIGINENIAFQKLINIKYEKNKETAFDFIETFEAAVRQYY